MALHLVVALGADPAFALAWAALLTYLLHGVIASGCVAALVRSRRFAASAQSYLWLAALFGPLLTAAIASGAAARVELIPSRQLTVVALAPAPGTSMPLTRAALVVLGLCALLGSARFGAALIRLRHRLRDRKKVEDARLLQCLSELTSRAALRPVVLTESSAIAVPLVIGRSEICIPAGGLLAAARNEIAAVLGHELAHLKRRDGLVFPLVGLLQAVLWMHPLNHWLAVQFRRCAELACDDHAVELTGDPVALAHALAGAATHASRRAHDALLPAMARPHSKSVLLLRVRRLLDDSPAARTSVSARWTGCGLVVANLCLSVQPNVVATPHEHAELAMKEIAELMQREQQLEDELALLPLLAAGMPVAEEARVLDLQQQLRHVHESAAWIERRFSGQVVPEK